MRNLEKEYKWMVRVSCMTFNHASYIEDAMNGFCMQETDFPFVCTIIDDASTDGEQEVIKRYLEEHFDLEDKTIVRNEETEDYVLTFTRHKTNKNCYFVVLYLKYNHYSIKKTKMPYIAEWHENCKYIALCEGDDYWISANKLQKQVYFLEGNTDYSMCFHNAFVIKTGGKKRNLFSFNLRETDSDFYLEDAIMKWEIPTASILYRSKYALEYPTWMARIYSGDLSLSFILLMNGKGRYINAFMSVYNLQIKGNSMTSIALKKKKTFVSEQHKKLISSLYQMPQLTDSSKKAIERKLENLNITIEYSDMKERKIWWKLFYKKELLKMLISNVKRYLINNYFSLENI